MTEISGNRDRRRFDIVFPTDLMALKTAAGSEGSTIFSRRMALKTVGVSGLSIRNREYSPL